VVSVALPASLELGVVGDRGTATAGAAEDLGRVIFGSDGFASLGREAGLAVGNCVILTGFSLSSGFLGFSSDGSGVNRNSACSPIAAKSIGRMSDRKGAGNCFKAGRFVMEVNAGMRGVQKAVCENADG